MYEYDIEDIEDEGDAVYYDKSNGAYLHIVDYILSRVESNNDWGEFIKELN